jgi:hypothetical protein
MTKKMTRREALKTLGLAIGTVTASVSSVSGLTSCKEEKKRLIFTEPTRIKAKNGRYYNGSLRYTIRPLQDAIDYFDEQQMQRLVQAKIKREREEALRKYDEKRKKTG